MELKNIFENENEKPLDTIPEDGGYTAIFRTIACVGDSLSSGEFEADNGNGGSSWHDMYFWGFIRGWAPAMTSTRKIQITEKPLPITMQR